MKRALMLIAAVCIALLPNDTALAQFGGLFGSGTHVPTIGATELKSLLDKQASAEAKAKSEGTDAPKSDFVVVDVRSEAETKVSVIPGAITKAQYEADAKLYQGRTVIPYCTIGGRSGRYAQQLQKDGVKTKNFKGSILEWVQEELPLVTLDGKPTNRVHTYSDRYRVPARYEAVTK